MVHPLLDQSAVLVGASQWHTNNGIIVYMVEVNRTELVQAIDLLITDHANTYALVLRHFPNPYVH